MWLLAELVGFAALLFVSRYLARGYLVTEMDQECHIGGIAIDVLAHGVRFPLVAYAPNEYDNGSFFSGLLAALSFMLLGRNVLALKLVTHLIAAAGAVATLWLLRGCLLELGLTGRRLRWVATTVLVIAIALAPRVVTMLSMYAVGNHTEGSAIGIILLALFSRRAHTRSAPRTAAYWVLVGFALYLNKGTFLVIPVLAAVQIALAWRTPRHLVAAFGGFVLGMLPELLVIAQQYGGGWGILGWATVISKEQRNSHAFPRAFLHSLLFLGEYRAELLAVWALAIGVGTTLLVRTVLRLRRARSSVGTAPPAAGGIPVTLALVVGVSWLHLAALSVMAKSGLDEYVIYAYPTLVVLYAVLVAAVCAGAAARWGERAEAWVGAAAIAATLVCYRPYAVTWGSRMVSELWHNHTGAACSWRFAEGFRREHEFGLAPAGQTLEQHAIARCRSLSEEAQVLDCIGGIARELHWRQWDTRVEGEPPAGLSAAERRAYAYHWGTHRKGDMAPCREFASPDLTAICTVAVEVECLHYADIYTRLVSAQDLGPPRCNVGEPPIDGFWAARRLDLLTRKAGTSPNLARAWGDDNLDSCKPVFDECY